MQSYWYEGEKKEPKPTTNGIRTGKQTQNTKKTNLKPYKTVFICSDDDGDDATKLSPLATLNVHTLQRWHTKNNFVFIYIPLVYFPYHYSTFAMPVAFHFLVRLFRVFFSSSVLYILQHTSFSCIPNVQIQLKGV